MISRCGRTTTTTTARLLVGAASTSPADGVATGTSKYSPRLLSLLLTRLILFAAQQDQGTACNDEARYPVLTLTRTSDSPTAIFCKQCDGDLPECANCINNMLRTGHTGASICVYNPVTA